MSAPQLVPSVVHPVLYRILGRGPTVHITFPIFAMSSEIATPNVPAAATAEGDYLQKRRSRRVKMSRPVRVRPSEPRDEHFEDLITSVNASKEGIYFHSRRTGYYKG